MPKDGMSFGDTIGIPFCLVPIFVSELSMNAIISWLSDNSHIACKPSRLAPNKAILFLFIVLLSVISF